MPLSDKEIRSHVMVKNESINFLVEKTIYNHYSHIERKNQSITQLKLLKIVKFYIVRAHGQMLFKNIS